MTSRTTSYATVFDGTAALEPAPCRLVVIEGGRGRDASEGRAARRDAARHARLSGFQYLAVALCGALVALAILAVSIARDSVVASRLDAALGALPQETVVVRDGDTLWSIAASRGELPGSTEDVVSWVSELNHIEGGLITPGQRIVVPVAPAN